MYGSPGRVSSSPIFPSRTSDRETVASTVLVKLHQGTIAPGCWVACRQPFETTAGFIVENSRMDGGGSVAAVIDPSNSGLGFPGLAPAGWGDPGAGHPCTGTPRAAAGSSAWGRNLPPLPSAIGSRRMVVNLPDEGSLDELNMSVVHPRSWGAAIARPMENL
ncbi:hypothetical protein D9M69_587580 [compost metagenome]